MTRRLTGREKRVGGYDLMWNDGPVYREDASPEAIGSSCFTANTHLGIYIYTAAAGCIFIFQCVSGCVNDRKRQLRQMLKPLPGHKRI